MRITQKTEVGVECVCRCDMLVVGSVIKNGGHGIRVAVRASQASQLGQLIHNELITCRNNTV